MPNLEYVPLHVHTTYSPDGLGPVDSLVEFAAKNFRAMAVTDHGTLSGIAEFWSVATAAGLRPIFGDEIYISGVGGKRGHLTVLASGEVGFANLVGLNNTSHLNVDSRGFPITTLEMLEQFNEGLTVLSGCSASPLYQGSEAEAVQFMSSLYDIFGKERLIAEVMGVYHEDNVTRPLVMAKRFGLLAVVTTDSHFVRKNQSGAHKIMTQCRKGYDYSSDDLYLKTPEELLQTSWFKGVLDTAFLEKLMVNTLIVADRLESFDLSAPPTLPKADVIEINGVPVNIIEAAKFAFEHYTMDPAVDVEVAKERLEREITVIEELGLVDYFSILNDIVQFCKRSNIKIGPGRGSGGGSFFLYLLGITEVDPIVHDLLFERFLSASRKDMADFDLDVDAERRDEVLEYARSRWGALPIANFSTYGNAMLVRDLGRIYKVPMEITEKAAELGDTDPAVLEEFFAYCKDTPTGSGFIVLNSDARTAYDSMLSQVRHTGKHAGGVVICTRPVPIEGGKVVWVEGVKNRILSKVGLVKYDILGVTALAQLQEMENLTGVAPGEPWYSDAPEVFRNIFQSGETTGVFQFSGSQGIVELTKQVRPESLADLAAINALYRPGPLDSGMAWEYPEAKNAPRKLHPDIDKILEDTYGIIVFQEQVMALVATITGGNLEEADDARKIISKGKIGDPVWQGKMRKLEDHFKTEGVKRFDQKLVDLLWSEIVTFGRYGFNKSHSVAYSLLAYRMAWYKHYFPGAFYTALLNSDQENAEKWVYDGALHGVDVVPPHINYSDVKWRWDKEANVVYAPLSVVKYFGEKGAAEVVRMRSELGGEFKNIMELNKIPKKSLNKRAKRLLYFATAFRGVPGNISEFLEDYAELPILSDSDAQMESFGFVLPTRRIVEFLKGEHARGRIAGFVHEIEERNKGKGIYKVYRLVPSGSFWTKDAKLMGGIKEGHCVSVKLGNYGNGEDVKRLKL